LKTTIEARRKPVYALDDTRFQSMDFRARHINQQSLM
jgi:hypothetical protein